MIKQSFLKRKPKSDVAQLFVGVITRDKKDRPRTLVVPGSKGKRYYVILRRYGRVISAECRLDVGRNGFLSCPGNGKRRSHETICYHSRAAIDHAIKDVGFTASWCVSVDDAQRMQRMIGGTIFTVRSHQNDRGTAYIVVVRKN